MKRDLFLDRDDSFTKKKRNFITSVKDNKLQFTPTPHNKKQNKNRDRFVHLHLQNNQTTFFFKELLIALK